MIKFYISFLLVGLSSLGFSQSTTSNQSGFIPDSIVKILESDLAEAYGEANQEIIDISEAWLNLLKANEYQIAAETVFAGLEKYPHSFALQTRLAAVLGDYAGQLSGTAQIQLIQKSKNIFGKLFQELEKQPKRDQFYFNNEYGYRFALYKQQYENGVAMIDHYFDQGNMKAYGYKGYYFQGVGAANYAKQLLLKGEKDLAVEYANKAVIAWAQYLTYYNDYYNAYVHYGMALGILGHRVEMKRALTRGAELIHTDLNYYEFKEVLDFIKKIYPSEND